MSEAMRIMDELGSVMEEEVDSLDIRESSLPRDVQLITPHHLGHEVLKELGPEASNEYMDLVLYGKMPLTHPLSLRKFFEKRRDLVSRACLAKLESQ